jgi:DNA-binding GntR family transcriptional regulator
MVDTAYGRLLAIKLTLVLPPLGVAAANGLWLRPRLLQHAREAQEDIRHLKEVLRENERTHLADPEVGSLSLAFEAALGRVARNPLLARWQRVVHDLWLEAWGGLGIAPATKHMFHTEHLEILRRVEARDARGAAEAMRRHVDRNLSQRSWQEIIADERRRMR